MAHIIYKIQELQNGMSNELAPQIHYWERKKGIIQKWNQVLNTVRKTVMEAANKKRNVNEAALEQ